jgi:fatty acid desaturase
MVTTVWRYSARDALLLAPSAAQLALNLWLAATWNGRSWAALCWLWPTSVLLFWYNAVVVTHNFVHTPWFAYEVLNRVYAVVDSINLGVPLTLCRCHHLNHHRYVNDRLGDGGRTRDRSSTYRFGRTGKQERALTYALLGLFRGGTVEAWRDAAGSRQRAQLLIETAACLLGLAGYVYLSWRYVLGFFMPVFYLGSSLGVLTNFYQHAGASPESRRANAVSHYGRLYNLLCCNEGYHQEHHVRPGLHWSRRPGLRATLPSRGRVISPVPPLIGFLARGSTGKPVETRTHSGAPTGRP